MRYYIKSTECLPDPKQFSLLLRILVVNTRLAAAEGIIPEVDDVELFDDMLFPSVDSFVMAMPLTKIDFLSNRGFCETIVGDMATQARIYTNGGELVVEQAINMISRAAHPKLTESRYA